MASNVIPFPVRAVTRSAANDNGVNPDPSGTVGNMLCWMPFFSAEAFADHLHDHRDKVMSLPVADRIALGRAAAAFYSRGAMA